MSVTLSTVRAYLLADANDQPLPSPQPFDLASDVIPYGATVRFEAQVQADEPLIPIGVMVYAGDTYVGRAKLFPVAWSDTVRLDVRLPWGVFRHPKPEGLTAAPRFPLNGWPPLAGGQYRLEIYPTSMAQSARREKPTTIDVPFTLGNRPAAGGAAPRITQLAGPPTSSVLLGQPWLAAATVEDADNDVLGVVFSVVRGGGARGDLLVDNGCCGDAQARDGVYSYLRVGGDMWDMATMGGARDVPIMFAAQAVDLRGNWSEPAVLNYTLRHSQTPLWMAEPAANAPAIEEVGYQRRQGTPDFRGVWARCDAQEAWVCARIITHPNRSRALFDDGGGPDEVARDGIYSLSYRFPRNRHLDMVFYAVPKSGSPRIGRRMALTVPPIG